MKSGAEERVGRGESSLFKDYVSGKQSLLFREGHRGLAKSTRHSGKSKMTRWRNVFCEIACGAARFSLAARPGLPILPFFDRRVRQPFLLNTLSIFRLHSSLLLAVGRFGRFLNWPISGFDPEKLTIFYAVRVCARWKLSLVCKTVQTGQHHT